MGKYCLWLVEVTNAWWNDMYNYFCNLTLLLLLCCELILNWFLEMFTLAMIFKWFEGFSSVLTHWSYIFLALSHGYHLGIKVTIKVTANAIGGSGGYFTNVSRALQNNLLKIKYAINHIYGENLKLKLCTCAQSMALGTRTKFQLEILTRCMISTIHTFRENIFESSQNVSETTPRYLSSLVHIQGVYMPSHMTFIPSKHFVVTKIRGHIVLRFG